MIWDIRGKSVLVTGASSGIGLEASLELARRGARVLMVGRDPARIAAAQARAGTGVEILRSDFSSLESVRELAEQIRQREDTIDVLVNNAGTVNTSRTETLDGIETTLAVNHLAPFLLTNLLLDRITARVVTVSSVGHRNATLDLDDLGFAREGYSAMKAYARSKLCNVLFANELARRLTASGSSVTSTSLHPGGVSTNIWNVAPWWAKPIVGLLRRTAFISAEQGGSYLVNLAANPALEGATGRYFDRDKEEAPSPLAREEELATLLWDVSAKLVSLPT